MNIIRCSIGVPSSQCDRHNHNCWEIIYRLSGTTKTTITEQTYSISEGDIIIIPPGIFHSDIADSTFFDLVIHIDYLDFSDLLILHDREDYACLLMQMIHRTLLDKDYNYTNFANSLMEALYQYIKRLSCSIYHNSFVYKLKNIIYANLGNSDFNLTQEIENTGFHSDYVRKCFKAETGKTPLTYLTGLRIDKAKQLLTLHTYESIENVSANCGFRDSFYFSTCFKKHTGLSPLQYRKQNMPK